MKLYYSAGSCSTSCHIALEESGLKHEAIEIDFDNESDPNLALINRLNPLGTLPVMVVSPDKVLSQNISILTFIAESAPEKKLLPAAGTLERAEAMNWLSFVASDLHKAFSPLWATQSISSKEDAQADIRKWGVNNVNQYLAHMEKNLAGKDFLCGKAFTIADAYCFVVTSWTKYVNISLDPYPNVRAYMARVMERPAVQKVMKLEGLV